MLSKRILVLVSLLLVSFLLVGCAPTVPEIGNQAPSIDSSSITTAEVGVEYTYDVEATDPDFDTLTYSLTRNPSGMVIGKHTGKITWTPNSAGSFGVTVKVSDGVLYATQPFTITITPVTWLTGITVDPETMDLEVEGEAGTFTVIANYSDATTTDVTTDCVYTLPTPTTGVITVIAGSVTAVKAGTDTILISYTTEGEITATANISVTVSRVRIPMEITVVIPTFTTGEPYWFTVKMLANDDSGKSVVASFDWPISGGVKIAGTLETDVESGVTFTLEGDTFRTDPFAMEDTIVNFRGTFTSPGTYTTAIEVETTDGIPLCSKEITIVVEATVGDIYGGGIVAYILQDVDPGYNADIQHGLIAALTDQSGGIIWATEANQSTEVIGTLFTIGSGSVNTDLIIEQNGEGNTYAAGLARAYGGGGFNDWFLPSKDELGKLYDNRDAIGSFDNDGYWSSSEYEYNAILAYHQSFVNGTPSPNEKNITHKVRAVRAF